MQSLSRRASNVVAVKFRGTTPPPLPPTPALTIYDGEGVLLIEKLFTFVTFGGAFFLGHKGYCVWFLCAYI